MNNILQYFNPLHGLELHARPSLNFSELDGRDNENGILFLVEWMFLQQIKMSLKKEDAVDFLNTSLQTDFVIIKNLSVLGYPGLYHRGYGKLKFHEVTGEIVDISHDNITAIACYSISEREKILAHAKKYQWRFDNAQPEKPRWTRVLHPRDIIFLGYLNKNWWAYPFLPLLSIMAIFSCVTKWVVRPTWYQKIWDYFFKVGLSAPYKDIATSGKCLWFVRFYATRERLWSKITWKVCEWLMVKIVKLNFFDAIHLYFKQRTPEYHPIMEVCDAINSQT